LKRHPHILAPATIIFLPTPDEKDYPTAPTVSLPAHAACPQLQALVKLSMGTHSQEGLQYLLPSATGPSQTRTDALLGFLIGFLLGHDTHDPSFAFCFVSQKRILQRWGGCCTALKALPPHEDPQPHRGGDLI